MAVLFEPPPKKAVVSRRHQGVLSQTGTFLLADVMSGIGGSPATVRKAVDELIEAGQVEKLGPMPDYQGRGRAPVQYSRG